MVDKGSGERGEKLFPSHAEVASSGNQSGPGRSGSAESSPLTYGFIWPVCSVKTCGEILGLQIGNLEDDGLYSHSYCERHFADAMREVLGGGR